MAVDRQLDEPVNEFGVGNAALLPEPRVHADLGEPRYGIYFIHDDFFILRKEEIHPRHALTAQYREGPYCKLFQRRKIFIPGQTWHVIIFHPNRCRCVLVYGQIV